MDPVERTLVPQWAPELVALSYCISWLGAYTSTQIIIHAKYTKSTAVKWVWTLIASLAYGFCAIWSMHFVGMLACRLDVRIAFDLDLTILSAIVAVVFTFAALSSGYAEATAKSWFVQTLAWWMESFRTRLLALLLGYDPPVQTAGYEALSGTEADEDERRSRASSDRPDDIESAQGSNEGEVEDAYDETDDEAEAALERPSVDVPPQSARDHARTPSNESLRTTPPVPGGGPGGFAVRSTTTRSPRPQAVRQRSHPPLARTLDSNSPSTSTLSSSSSSERQRRHMRASSELSGTTLALSTTSSSASSSWGESLHVGLSREARIRIKARARERPVPEFGWKYWVMQYYATLTVLVFVRAAIWGLALVLMHYCGMWAMHIPGGRISWDLGIVVLSYVVAFAVCLVACITMEHMEVHFGRQVAFSTIAALGVCSMHYTGMAAATFYTYSPPFPPGEAGYPTFLPITIVGVAVFVCVVSNVVLAHSAITARNRMAEMILTKRRLWRIMAEKEAAEQATELKQQFISVASHEIRTPLHTVNGYCDLLSRTDLSEEQVLYVSSIQQACHAINVIAGNVLDFSKLDRDNVELSARPVLMQIRKMVEDLAKITEARGTHPGQESGVEVIVSVTRDVPNAIYLDETYTFRVLMNLLSNAQKFCDRGYICVAVSMAASDQVLVEVSDTGCGIPKGFRAAIFEPFRQADTSLTRPRQGTGLGLSIVKHLVQRMNGTVDVDSEEGEGAMFTVRLPITPHTPTASQTHSPELPVTDLPKHPPKRLKVLNVNERTQDLLEHLFTQHGFVVSGGLKETVVQEIVRDYDAVWTDVDSVAHSPLLRRLLSVPTSRPFPVFILHSDTRDVAPLEPGLSSDGKNVILVKRPLIIHTLLDKMDDPQPYMGTHITADSQKVRFAIPSDMITTGAAPFLKDKFRARGSPRNENVSLDELEVVEMKEKEKVLLVEDNMINQRLGRRMLERLGYEVHTASDGQQAVEKIKITPYYCCLMDCQMPVLDGFGATRKIREMEATGEVSWRMPIIALTANVTGRSEEQCKAAGMDHFLPKPLNMDDLDSSLKLFGRTPDR